MDAFLEFTQTLMQLVRERRETLPQNENLKHNRIALLSGLADAFQANGIPAEPVSANAKIGLADISNIVALKFGSPEHVMDIDGNVGWDAILDNTLSRTQVRITQETPANLTIKSFTIEQCRQALWPGESNRVDQWAAEDKVTIAAKLIDLATIPRTGQSYRPRL
jgi:hypothetical protein